MEPENSAFWTYDYPAVLVGMPAGDYHAVEAYSASGLKLIERSPAHYAHAGSRAPSRAMQIGTAIHCALLEPKRFEADYVCSGTDDRRASEYKQAVKSKGGDDDWVLTQPEWDKVVGMQAAAYAHPEARSVLNCPGEEELSVFAEDPETGLAIKCRPDKLAYGQTGPIIADVKKCQDARPEEFAKSVARYGYDLAAAHYIETYKAATDAKVVQYLLIAIEEEPPHGVMVYELPVEWLNYGLKRRNEALRVAAQCVESGEWPAYGEGIEQLDPPKWIAYQIDENEAEVKL